jgi:hypothetical protein
MNTATSRSLWRRLFRGSRSGAGRRCDRNGIRQYPEPEFDFFQLVTGQVAILPLVVVDQTVPYAWISTMSFNVTVPAIGLENGDNVDGVRNCQGSIT